MGLIDRKRTHPSEEQTFEDIADSLSLEGFYDHILAHLDHVVTQGLLRPEHRDLLLADPSLDGILDAMERYQAPPRPTWATRPRP